MDEEKMRTVNDCPWLGAPLRMHVCLVHVGLVLVL